MATPSTPTSPTSGELPGAELSEVVQRALRFGVLYHDVDRGQPCFKCESCPGFELHFWRKICAHCKCSKGSHGYVANKDVTVGKLEFGQAPAPEVVKIERTGKHWLPPNARRRSSMPGGAADLKDPLSAAMRAKYSWVPEGLNDSQVTLWFEPIPLPRQPLIGTAGEVLREQMLERQLPRHDSEVTACSSLTTSTDTDAFMTMLAHKHKTATDVGTPIIVDDGDNCFRCGGRITKGQVAVKTTRVLLEGQPAVFHHDSCFCCDLCEEPLVDLVYFRFRENRLLCGRHWNDMHRPRCNGCDETIYNDEFTIAEGKNWHPAHFACLRCDRPLDDEYVMVDDQPTCLKCNDARLNTTCAACKKLIETKSGKVSDGKPGGKSWHATCYVCSRCKAPLDGQACFPVNNELLCHDDYYSLVKKAPVKSLRRKLSSRPGLLEKELMSP